MQKSSYSSLWLKTWKYFVEESHKIRHKSDRLRIIMLCRGENVYLHSIAFLACTWSDLRPSLRVSNRHVVFRVHHGWVVDRSADLPWWGRSRTSCVLYGGSRHPACNYARWGSTCAVVFWPQLDSARDQEFTRQGAQPRQ